MVFRKFFIFSLIFLVSVSAPSFAWKFASLADSRGSTNGVNVTELTKIIDRINLEGVDIVIFEGDAVNGSTSSDSTLNSQMDTWVSTMNRLKVPWYYCPGNHEINLSTSQSVLCSKVVQPLNGPSTDQEMVFSFDHQNAHFAFLNSDHYGLVHTVQRTWLANDLAKTTQPLIFVGCHEPAYPVAEHVGSSLDAVPSQRDDLWNKMTAGRVSMVFNGHEHLYSRTKHGNIFQVINGTCGATIATGFANTIAKYNYVVVDVNGNTVQCQAKDDAGNVLDSWSFTVTPPPSSNVSLTLSVDKTTAYPSNVVTYTLTYTNSTGMSVVNGLVKLPVPANTTYVVGSASAGGVYDAASKSVSWTVPSLAPGASGKCSMQVKIQ